VAGIHQLSKIVAECGNSILSKRTVPQYIKITPWDYIYGPHFTNMQ